MNIVPSAERTTDRAARRADAQLLEIAAAIREARMTHGISQAAVARAVRIPQSELSLIERGKRASVSLRTLVRLCAVVGLDLSCRAFSAGAPIRDIAHLELLDRLRKALASTWSWRSEVPFPIQGDRRAWDRVMRNGPLAIAVEAETRPRDLQSLERRLELKRRDGGVDRLILVMRESKWNRTLVRSDPAGLSAAFPIPGPVALRALADGRDPGGDAIIFL